MTEGNCMKLIVQFFLPILAGNFFQQFYNFIDSVIVGKGIGDAALAAVGNNGSVHFFILGFMIGLTGGLGIYISQSFGAQDYGKMRQETAMSVLICLGIGVVVTILSLLAMRPLFTFLNTPQDMMKDTISYFRIILIGSTVTVCNNFAMTLLRCVGNSRVPLIVCISGENGSIRCSVGNCFGTGVLLAVLLYLYTQNKRVRIYGNRLESQNTYCKISYA